MLRHLRSVSAWLLSSVIALSGVVAPQPGSAAGNGVTDVSYGKTDGAFTVSVAATGSVSTHVQRLSVDQKQNLQDLVIDVSPASYDGQTKVIGFSSGSIRQVRLGQLSASPAIMRIVVEAHGTPQYHLKAGTGNKTVTLRLPTSQVAYTLPTAQAVAAARQAQSQQTSAIGSTGKTGNAAPAPKPAVVASKPALVAVKPAQAAAPQPKPAVHAAPAPKPAVAPKPAAVAPKPAAVAPKPQTVAMAPAPSA